MESFSADPFRRSIYIGRSIDRWSITIILLQLTSTAVSSIIPLPGHHLHHPPPQGLHSPVRWTKSPETSRQRRPVEVMTDVINDLGVRILDRYIDNNGNVGFSPSGLGFVLVALYEGSAGSSSREISDVLGLPRDRRVTRIGLRDIHRRLRSYLNADAFLGGLTLNRDDINLRPDYEDILRFYGFDISDSGIDSNATTTPDAPMNSTDSSNSSTTSVTPDSTTITDSIDATTVPVTPVPATTMINDTTITSDVATISTDMTGGTNAALSMIPTSSTSIPSSLTIMSQTAMTNATLSMISTSSTSIPSSLPIMSQTAMTDSMTVNSTSSTNPPSTSPMSAGTTGSPSTSTVGSSTNMPDVQAVTNSTDASSTVVPMQRLLGLTTESADSETQSSDTFPTSTDPTTLSTDSQTDSATTFLTTPATTPIGMTEDSLVGTEGNSSTPEVQNATTNLVEDTATNNVRKRRGILHGPSGYFSSSADDGIWLDEFSRLTNHDDYPSQDEDIGADPRRPTEVAFLVNGCDYSRVTAAVYTAFLPFSYFPSLRASMLEFPLDDPRYKILVMLPSDENGTRRLARILATKSITLRQLRRSLQPTWVTAVIPSFMLRGFVTLTPFLERLGISDVFDPRAADLTPMSPDLGVYARDIQQSIGVNIRNNIKGGIGGADGGNEDQQGQQRDDLLRTVRGVEGIPPFFVAGGAISPRSRANPHYPPYPGAGSPLYERAPPVPFVVDRPFLYFIVDDETSVTLLAGRIDDPLNSRLI